MKRSIFFIAFCGLLICPQIVTSQSASDFTVQAGYNLVNTIKGIESYSGSSSLPSLFLEYHLYPISSLENLGLGIGAGFLYSTTDDSNIGWAWTYDSPEKGELFYWPLYLSLIYRFDLGSSLTPYVKVDNGYNFFEVSDNILVPDDRYSDCWYGGGYYFSSGVGLYLGNSFHMEASFSILNSYIACDHQYSGYWFNWDEEYKVSVLNVSAGFTF
jgi:hypothetical protein